MGTVSSIRKTVLPQELYDLVFGFAVGDSLEILVTVIGHDGEVSRHKFSNESCVNESVSSNQKQPNVVRLICV